MSSSFRSDQARPGRVEISSNQARPGRAEISNASGFTLLELLIAIAILAFISFGIYQAITETFRLRDILSAEGDFYNSIRLSTDIIRRDVSLIYTPKLMMPSTQPSPGPSPVAPAVDLATATDMGELTLATKFWGPALDKTGIRPARFVGSESRMTFISASHLRIYKDAPESDFAKVVYELGPDDTDLGKEAGTSVLRKIENANVFGEDDANDKASVAYPILYGITKFRLRYYQKSRDVWLNAWDSDREETRNIYPDIIELSISVSGPQRLSFDGTYLFRPEVPLNGLDPST